MQRVSLDRSNLPQTAMVVLVSLVALAALVFVAAYWTWAWFAPRPVARSLAAAEHSGAPADALFGNVQRDQGAAPSAMAIRLLGLVAAMEGHLGYAVVQLESKEIVAVPEGKDVTPGIRLAEVGIDFVILERGGNRETLAWPEKNMVTLSPVPRARQ